MRVVDLLNVLTRFPGGAPIDLNGVLTVYGAMKHRDVWSLPDEMDDDVEWGFIPNGGFYLRRLDPVTESRPVGAVDEGDEGSGSDE